MKPKPLPSFAELHAVFRLDLQTGFLFWRYRHDMPLKWNARFAGKPAGYRHLPRSMVTINYERYFVSRIVFKMIHNAEPEMVDHKNRENGDHRPNNLRPASRSQNAANSRHRKRLVHSLPRGVFASSSRRNPYKARVGKRHLGMFATVAAAKSAVIAASKLKFGEFANV